MGAVLYSVDTGQSRGCDLDLMQDAFQLTDAEAALIEPVTAGLTNAEIAALRERSIETVKVQVKSLLAKTQCTNRTQLVQISARFNLGHLLSAGTIAL